MPAGLTTTIPALPARDVRASAAFLRDRFRFEVVHESDGFAIVRRDAAVLHLWGATDESWRERADLGQRPVVSGAESFLAGTASCRIAITDVDGLYAELAGRDVLHPTSRAGVAPTAFGTREFATLDLDGNLLRFFATPAP